MELGLERGMVLVLDRAVSGAGSGAGSGWSWV
jgi:hypothetical protein